MHSDHPVPGLPPAARTFTLPTLRGGPWQLLLNHDPECILAGCAESGKTVAACTKLVMLCCDSTRALHIAMCRKTFHSIHASCGRTFRRLLRGLPVRRYGTATYTDRWVFPSGSEVVCAGLDNPDKLLSAEFDVIYVCQCEQLREADWETLCTRCTGRGAAAAYPQIIGDCNPAGKHHWIPRRAKAGRLTLLTATHRDNPELYDEAGQMTEEGRRRIGQLDRSLTGLRHKRLFEGLWATAEGAVYDMFNPAEGGPHVRTRDAGEFKRWFLAIDYGYTNPCALLLVGEDGDGRWHVAREFYETGKLESDIVEQARQWCDEFKCGQVAVDAAVPGLVAALSNQGLNAQGGKGGVLEGVRKIQDRLKVQPDGAARLTFDPGCPHSINDFESYLFKPGEDVPVKENDHACDALRYLENVLGPKDAEARFNADQGRMKTEFYKKDKEKRERERGHWSGP